MTWCAAPLLSRQPTSKGLLRIMQPYNIPVSCLQQLCILFQLQHIHVKRLRATQQQKYSASHVQTNSTGYIQSS
jgi:uncharacterized membrane protein YwaF